ncbi:uncharacterized protein LOC132737853 isoform X2 [Ruditapes philippinarum]|uniref:uncharacterized protein LOC132737853 isoform X2 n=1 Tax=Ruditapes philippinarum TaxID=129788 RepID=UPI00295AAAF3|nr:uncharacterized protein LOC132737853 isoform X2 [Ruditapes philippinarum]
MRMASEHDNNAPLDKRILQCLVLMIKEQSTQKEVLNKLTADMGQFRENMYAEFEKMQDSIDFINRKLTSGKRCVCGGDTGVVSQQNVGTKHKTKSRRQGRQSPDNSDDDTDPNINIDRGKHKKRTDKRGKRNVNGNATLYNMSKAPLPSKALLKPQPQETDFIELMKSLKVEVNPATIAAVSSAVQKKGTGRDSRPPALHTVVIVDISESMKGKPFDTAKSFVNTVIDGIDTSAGEFGLEEYIAVITCGQATGIAQPFTNDYVQVRNTLDRLVLGGRTPLMTSLTLALCYLELQSECVKVGTHIIMPRVIIVSDFDATIDTQFKGRDADNSEDRIKVQRELFKLGLTYKSREYGVFCVPIGESNRPVTEGFISKCGGEIVPHKGAQNVGNYYRYQVTIGRALLIMTRV